MAFALTKTKNRLSLATLGQLILVALASLFLATVVSDTSHAATWVDNNTIAHDGKDFSRSDSKKVDGESGNYIVFAEKTDSSCKNLIYFSSGTDLDTAKKATYKSFTSGLGCTEQGTRQINLTNTRTNPDEEAANGKTEENQTEACSAGALGWFICPFVEGVADTILSVGNLIGGFLDVNPLSFDNKNPLFQAWQNILIFANLALVIAFLYIIFSQATSIGLSSYGIKSMLPRVIAAAIMMNLSYFLAAILVDASNIAGNGIGDLLLAARTGVGGEADNDFGSALAGALQTGAVGLALGVTAIGIGIFLLFNLPIVLGALLIFFILIAARQAIIVVLVMIAPLAFAAWILPNTEKYFKKWLDLFTQMLIIFPVFMALFAGAVVAGDVIIASADSMADKIMGLIIITTPVFAIPFVLKSSSSALDKVATIAQRNVKRAGGDKMDEAWKRRRATTAARMANNNMLGSDNKFKRGVGRSARFVGGYKARRDFKIKTAESNAAREQQESLGKILETSGQPGMIASKFNENSKVGAYVHKRSEKSSFARRAAGAGGEAGALRAQAQGIDALDKLRGEELKAGQTVLENAELTNEQRIDLAVKGQTTNINGREIKGGMYQNAAMAMLSAEGQMHAVDKMFAESGNMDAAQQGALAYFAQQNYSTFKKKGHLYNNQKLKEKLVKGEAITKQDLEMAAADLGGLNSEQFAGQDPAALQHLIDGIANGTITGPQAQKARDIAVQSLDDTNVYHLFKPQTVKMAQQIAGRPVTGVLGQTAGSGPAAPTGGAPAGQPPTGPLTSGQSGTLNIRGQQGAPGTQQPQTGGPQPTTGSAGQPGYVDPNTGLWVAGNPPNNQGGQNNP